MMIGGHLNLNSEELMLVFNTYEILNFGVNLCYFLY